MNIKNLEDKKYIICCIDKYFGLLCTLGPFTEEEAFHYAEEWKRFTFGRVAEVKNFYSNELIKRFE